MTPAAPVGSRDRPGPWRLLARWVPVLVSAAWMALPVPPVQDLPAQAALIQVAGQPDPLWVQGPWTGHSAAFYGIGGLLSRVIGGLAAAQVLAGLGLLLLPLGAGRLARWIEGDEDLATWGGALLGMGHIPWMGFLPFQVALGATLCLLPEVLRRRTALGTAAWALLASAVVWSLHALALPGLWLGLLGLAPDRSRRLAALAALPLPFVIWQATGADHGGVLWPPDPADLPDRLVRPWRFLGPPSRFLGWLPGTWLAGVAAWHLRGWPRSRPEARGAALVFLAFLALAAVLPDFLQRPRIVHPWIRLAPLAGALVVASLPRTEVPRVLRLLTLLVLCLCAAFTWVLALQERSRLQPAAEAIRSLPPGEVVLGVTLHRPPEGSWLRTYPALHLPFLYQADGLGSTLAPFTHGDSPVRLRPDAAAVADLALQDVQRYVAQGTPLATRVLTDGGDDPTFLAISGLRDLPPCPEPFPPPWRCLRLGPRKP